MYYFGDIDSYCEFKVFFGIVMARKYLYERGYGRRVFRWRSDYLEDVNEVVRQVFPVAVCEWEENEYDACFKITIADGSLAYLHRRPAYAEKAAQLVGDVARHDGYDYSLELKCTTTGAVVSVYSCEGWWFPWRIAEGLLSLKKYALEVAPWIRD